MNLTRMPAKRFCRLVDRTLAATRNGPTLSEDVKRLLRGLAKAADDLERGRGDVALDAAVASWLESHEGAIEEAAPLLPAWEPQWEPLEEAAPPDEPGEQDYDQD